MRRTGLLLGGVLLMFTAFAQPVSIDNTIFQSPVKDQGGRNTCSGFAVAACIETFDGVPADVSEQHIYAGLKMLEYKGLKDPVSPGGRINLYPQTLSKYGVLHESQMPYNPKQLDFKEDDYNLVQVIREGQTGPVSMLLNARRAKFYIDSADCEVAEFDAGLEAENIKRLLQQGVKAIGIGYYVNGFWFDWENKKNLLITPDSVGGFIDSSLHISSFQNLKDKFGDTVFSQIDNFFEPDGHKAWRFSSRQKEAGHAVTIVGYNENGFIIKNSWGKGWGNNGYATVSYDYHKMFAKRMLAIKRVRFIRQPTGPLTSLSDLRLKIVPQKGLGGGLAVSIFSLDEKSNPDISLVEYRMYKVNGLKRTMIDSGLALPSIVEYDNSFKTIVLKGMPRLLTLGATETLQADLLISSPGLKKPAKRAYKNIKWINNEYRAAIM
jgi:hypothetical protein